MKMYRFSRRMLVRKPLSEVFGFFERPQNLAKITPPQMGFKILTPGRIGMHSGTVIDYTVRVMGINWHWRTLITDYDSPHRFTDIQLKGPYAIWHHTHTFEDTTEGTLMKDEVSYALPFGFLGQLVHPLLVRPQLNRIFDYREDVISSIFGSNEDTELS